MNDDREYRLTLANLPTTIRGFVYLESDGVPRIVLNSNLTREMNRRTFRHEMDHILRGHLSDPNFIEYQEHDDP